MDQRSTRRHIPRLRRRARRGGPDVDPPTRVSGPDDGPPDPSSDPEGGTGVREPRRPFPTQPSGSLERERPARELHYASEDDHLDLTADRR